MRKTIIIAAALLPLAPFPAAAEAPEGARNVVVEVREDGRVVASSAVRLQLGRQAAVSLDGPYAMRLRIDAAEGAAYTVRPNLTANGPAGWTVLRTGPLTIAQGERGIVAVQRASGPPLELAVSVD